MIKTLLLLVALGLAQARPQFEDVEPLLHEFHPDCPPAEVYYLLPHEYDCTKYYYCEYGMKFIEPRVCAPGTEFSAELMVCVHPANSGCHLPGYSTEAPTTAAPTTTTRAPTTTTTTTTPAPTTTTSTTTTTTPAPTTTTSTTTTTTPAPTTTTSTTTTTTPAPTTTTSTTTTTTPAPTTTTSTTTTTTPAPTTTTAAPTTTTAAPTTAAPTSQAPVSTTTPSPIVTRPDCDFLPNGCPDDFSIHWNIPSENYCNIFYQCDNGKTVQKCCPAGLYFNPLIHVCDWPNNVKCNGTVNEDICISAPEDGGNDNDNDNGGGGGGGDDLLDNGCPADFSMEQLLPHETKCDKFYQCVHGNKVPMPCAPGTHFSYELQRCDWPIVANCSLSGEDGGGCDGSCPGVGSTTAAPGGGGGCDGSCPGDGSTTAAPGGGGGCDGSCPGDGSTTAAPGGGGGCDGSCPGDGSTTAAPGGGGGCDGSCPGDGSTTAAPGGGSTPAPGGSTTAAPGGGGCDGSCPDDGNDNGSTAAPGGGSTTAAPGGGSTATPGGGSTTAAPGGGSTAAPGGGSTTAAPGGGGGCDGSCPGDGNDNGSGEEPGTGDDDSGNVPDNKCVTECNVLPWAHETDCDKYWACNGDQQILVVCSEGLHFNPATSTCDFACNAGCARENIQATDAYDGIRVFVPWNKIDENIMSALKMIN